MRKLIVLLYAIFVTKFKKILVNLFYNYLNFILNLKPIEMGFEEIKEKFRDWKKCRVRTKKKLIELADKLDEFQTKSVIARATGLSITIAGSATTLTGILLAPSTFGLSISLAIGGTTVGAIGSITSIWGTVKKDLITRIICKEAEKLINEEMSNTGEFIQIFSSTHFRRQMENGIGGLIAKFGQESINIANLLSHAISAQSMGQVANAKFLLNPSHTLHYMGVGMSLLFVGLEFIRLVETSLELMEGTKCSFSDRIRTLAYDLDQNLHDFEDLILNADFKLNNIKLKRVF